jgi:putative ABC transport system permease protein
VRRGTLGEERVAFLCPDDQLETLNPKPRNPMLRNYLTVALRALRRSKGYTVINVVGFAVGIAVCLLIVLYVRHELSYDTFHEKSERLYRIVSQDSTGELSGATQAPMASAMARDFPAVEKAARLYGRSKTLFSYGQKRFYVEDGLRADSTFFDMLTFPLMRGNAELAHHTGDSARAALQQRSHV